MGKERGDLDISREKGTGKGRKRGTHARIMTLLGRLETLDSISGVSKRVVGSGGCALAVALILSISHPRMREGEGRKV